MSTSLEEAKRIARSLAIEIQGCNSDEAKGVFKQRLDEIPEEYRELVDHIASSAIIYGYKTTEKSSSDHNPISIQIENQIDNQINIDGKNMKNVDSILLIVGVVFMLIGLVVAMAFPNPTVFQIFVFRVFVALSGGAFAAYIPGMLDIDLKWVRGSGAIAVFLILYLVSPAALN